MFSKGCGVFALTLFPFENATMPSPEEIENLQRQVNELSEQLKQSQEKLFQLQQQLNSFDQKDTQNAHSSSQPASSVKHAHHNTLENFIGLRVIHLVGIVVLLIGISIGVKYAIDKNLITP